MPNLFLNFDLAEAPREKRAPMILSLEPIREKSGTLVENVMAISYESSYLEVKNDMPDSKFSYLVQGRASLVESFYRLQKANADLFVLTYDFPVAAPGRALFNPGVSWAEGRNILLEEARKVGYSYYIFLDDDAELSSGSFEEFETLLLTHEPYVGIPLTDVIEDSWRFCPQLEVQEPVALDQIVQAFSAEAVSDQIVLPFVADFDTKSWWYSCEINSFQILQLAERRVAQFNTVKFRNTNHSWSDNTLPEQSNYLGGISKRGLQEVWDWLVDENLVRGARGQNGFVLQRAISEAQKTCPHHYPGLIREFFIHLRKGRTTAAIKLIGRSLLTLTRAYWFRVRYQVRRGSICEDFELGSRADGP